MATEYINKFSFAKYLDSRYCMKCMAKDRTVNAPFLCHSCTINDMFHDLETYPTEDVVERKLGKWIDTEPHLKDWQQRKNGMAYYCSVCGHRAGKNKHRTYKYCPWCGAKMDGDSDV